MKKFLLLSMVLAFCVSLGCGGGSNTVTPPNMDEVGELPSENQTQDRGDRTPVAPEMPD